MFNAVEPIYTKFFEVLQQRFATDAYAKAQAKLPAADRIPNPFENAENLLVTLDMGFSLPLTGKTIVSHVMPYGCLEWCETDRVVGYRMPESYKYEIRLPLLIVTQAPRIESTGKIETLFPGIGRITQKLGGFFWRQYHTGRFGDAVDPDSFVDQWDWSIVEFSIDVRNPLLVRPSTDSPLLQRFRAVLESNPLCRGTQMNFYFSIEERKML